MRRGLRRGSGSAWPPMRRAAHPAAALRSQVSTGNADGFDCAGVLTSDARRWSPAGARTDIGRRRAIDVDDGTRRCHGDHARHARRRPRRARQTRRGSGRRRLRWTAWAERVAHAGEQHAATVATPAHAAIPAQTARAKCLGGRLRRRCVCTMTEPLIFRSKQPRDSNACRAPDSSPVAPQRVERRQRRQRRGLGAQHARSHAHGAKLRAQGRRRLGVGRVHLRRRPAVRSRRPAAPPRRAPAPRPARTAGAATRASARAASPARSRSGSTSGTRLRPHCSHAAIATCCQCARRLSARAASRRVTLRAVMRRVAAQRRQARPPSGAQSPCARRRPGPAPP